MSVKQRYCWQMRCVTSLMKQRGLALIGPILLFCGQSSHALAQTGQPAAPETTEQTIERLTAAVAKTQSQMEAYGQQLLELRQELGALRQKMAAEKSPASQAPSTAAASIAEASSESPATLDEIRERQAIEESQIATHEVAKVETQSKYPLKVSGLLLFNGFVNTRQVDISASPAYAISGSGSTGLSVRQTVLGFDARGPHLFSANSRADLRVDFFANGAQSNYAASGILRLRTAHAALDWPHTEAFFEVDRSILEPNEPSSLVAIAQPELAWAGNLWTWNPQVGVSHHFSFSDLSGVEAQAALIDPSEPQLPGTTSNSPVTESERSRWPGAEARVAFQHGDSGTGLDFGVGGYFGPQRDGNGHSFNAWAGTVDFRSPLSRYFEVTVNAHRGQALAGLGAGGYVNYYYLYAGSNEIVHALDDVGGWAQLKAKAGQRVQVNAGFGIDNPFAKEVDAALASLEQSPTASTYYYPGLARNRSVFSNVIYSPSAYLLFSLEYKRLWTNYATGPTYFSDSIGIGAGYKF